MRRKRLDFYVIMGLLMLTVPMAGCVNMGNITLQIPGNGGAGGDGGDGADGADADGADADGADDKTAVDGEESPDEPVDVTDEKDDASAGGTFAYREPVKAIRAATAGESVLKLSAKGM